MQVRVARLLLAWMLLTFTSFRTFGVETAFQTRFTKGFDADLSRGVPTATSRGAAARVDDRFGASLVLGPGAGSVTYEAKGNISLEHGALLLWARPDGWKRDSRNPVRVMQARAGNAWMALVWQPSDASLLFVRATRDGKTVAVSKPAYDWVQSAWHHVALLWSATTTAMYVDGQSADAASRTAIPSAIPIPQSEILGLGGEIGAGATLSLRGLTILTEPLSIDNLLARYRASVTGTVAHERPSLTLAPCQKPPVIDGKLSADEWDNAAGTAGFVEIGSGVLSSVGTRVYLTYDAKNLYIACRCPYTGALTGSKFARDAGTPWEEDCFEVFLQPEVGFTGKYYQILLNAFGSLYDMEDQNAAWNGVSQWAVDRGEHEWTGEIVVPFASLGTLPRSPLSNMEIGALPPNADTTWQANFCRDIGSGGTTARNTEWAFTGGSGYAVWQLFGSLHFNPNLPVVRLDSLSAPPAQGADLQLRLSNPTTKPARVAASVMLYRQGMADESEERTGGPWELAPGASKTETIKATTAFSIDQVHVELRDADTQKTILAQMVRAGSVVPTSATVSQPATGGTVTPLPKVTEEMLEQVKRERKLWENNRIGIASKIPPPWTPMKIAGKNVSCWGRSYDYLDSLFPRGVRTKNTDVLAGSISLVAAIGNKEILIQKAAKQTVHPAPNQVDIDSVASAAGLTTRVQSHIEYDGCVRCDLTLTPEKGPVTLDGLELRIPVQSECAVYYHWFEMTRDPRLTNAGALPPSGLKSHFKPLVWLGDDDRGFCWFCESPKGWHVKDKESTVQIERQRTATVIRIRIADHPFTINNEWKMMFGLMATPTRPMPQGWRDWLIPLNQSNPWGSWAPGFNNLSGTDDPGTLMPKDPAAMKMWVDQMHKEGSPVAYLPMREPTKVMPYSQIVFWSGKYRDGMPAPEIKLFGPEWSNQKQSPGPRKEPDDQIPLKEYYWVCPQSSFAQYYMYKLNQLIDETDIDGIYIDGPWNSCSNPLHGDGYTDENGQWQMEYKIWPYRDLLKRIYCLFYEKRKNPIVHQHTSCWLCIPSISFSHMELDGEQYHDAGQKVEDHFMDIVPLDKWRAEHTMRQWGPAPFLLPDIPPQWCRPDAPTRELLMLTNLHDTAMFPGNLNLRVFMRNYQARRLFGVVDCEFRGYWGNSDWVKCDTPEAYVSVYRKPDGSRCLLIVGNTTKSDATITLRPNFAGLKLQPRAVDSGVDLETGDRVPIQNGVMTLPVKARDFRLIALPFYQAPPITAGDVRAGALKEIPNPGFENGMTGWSGIPIEGNAGFVDIDKETKFASNASCHLHKADGPGGVMVNTENVLLIEPGKKYRANCQLKIANATGAKVYWMISMQDAEGNGVGTNNLFYGFLTANQDWKPFPYEFQPLPGTAVIRLHLLIAFPGAADAWVDDVRLEEVR